MLQFTSISLGLRKFRRQLTIEEQLQRTEGGAEVVIPEPPPELLDEADDIDVRFFFILFEFLVSFLIDLKLN